MTMATQARNEGPTSSPRETLPAVVRRHRRQRQLDRAIQQVDGSWHITPHGWALVGSDFEIHPTGDKISDHGYRVLKDEIHWASFSSPTEAISYVTWRAQWARNAADRNAVMNPLRGRARP
jgi:hypothetical protein